jgi:hypothetical protein
MAQDLTRLIRRRPAIRPARIANMPMAEVDPAILDSAVAARLGKRAAAPRPWISQRDLLDALMTFTLTFTGAMVFLL